MNLKVKVKGKGQISLSKADFVASGGEGQVFRKGLVAYKVYNDPRKMIPLEKIQELSVLTLPQIIRPQDVLLDDHNRPIGYTMRFLSGAFTLCQLFARAFRDRMKVKPDDMVGLVKKLQDIVSHCHDKRILVVDLNELNFLVPQGLDEVCAIDCDSYQTKSFPATAIMESIRDRHSKAFSELTDWFSFGVVSFQMLVGIHPYKGKHPKLKSLDERMHANASVFNKDVSVPAVCYPFDVIPQAYKDWYRAVFEDGKRLPPPTALQPVVAVLRRIQVAGSNVFEIRKVARYGERLLRFDPAARVAVTEKGAYKDSRLEMEFDVPVSIGLASDGTVVAGWLEGRKLRLVDVNRGQPIDVDVEADALMDYGGRIYAKMGDAVCEMDLLRPADRIFAVPVPACQVLEHATKVFDGVVIQDVLGACYASIFPDKKTCYQVHVRELDGARITAARHDGKVLMVVAFRAGKYDRHVIRVADDQSYDHSVVEDVGPVSPNFVTMPNGVCVHMNEQEEVEVFSNSVGSANARVFKDPALKGDMRLTRDGTTAMFCKGDELYSIEVKKP